MLSRNIMLCGTKLIDWGLSHGLNMIDFQRVELLPPRFYRPSDGFWALGFTIGLIEMVDTSLTFFCESWYSWSCLISPIEPPGPTSRGLMLISSILVVGIAVVAGPPL